MRRKTDARISRRRELAYLIVSLIVVAAWLTQLHIIDILTRLAAMPNSATVLAAGSTGKSYYVDYQNGDDANSGATPNTPWKHAPGDDNATGAARLTLQPGDTVVFKGGVTYKGTATRNGGRRVVFPNNSGTSNSPITYMSGHRLSPAWGSGRAIIDGGGPGAAAAKTGIYVLNRAWINIDGFEIRNIGQPTADAAAIEFEKGEGRPGVGHATVTNCLIHDVNWSGTYVRGYGIENNRGSSHLYERNEIYNVTDKLIETFGGGTSTPGSDDASNVIIRHNVLHDAAVHCVVLTSDSGEVYNNVIWQCNNGVIPNSPNPGYALKVDQGRNNKVFNNLAYEVNAGWGVLVGTGNQFSNNIIYGLGKNGSGTHGSNDEAAIVLYNDDGSWPRDALDNNTFYNNIVYYIPGADAQDKPKFVYHNAGGSNNEVKNNVFWALLGDQAATPNRIRATSAASGGGPNSYFSLANWQLRFGTLTNGAGNVASGNVVVEPDFVGGRMSTLANKPTGFTAEFADLNTPAFQLNQNSAALISGVALSGPASKDLRGNVRTAFWPGLYDPKP
jgi:hypothetical protein